MIHHRATLAQLVAAIDLALGSPARRASWWRRAHADFLRAVKTRRFNPQVAIWSEVKGAFIALQAHKCAYCETPMPQGSKSAIAYDVEHHRPKSRTRPWPTAATAQRLGINYRLAHGRSRGYPELAHHPYNYAVACKVCNSPYKSDHFPLLGRADERAYWPPRLNQVEQPAIPLPLGDWGEDPEAFLTFHGFVAVPQGRQPAHVRRAQAVIDFFELNNRVDLLRGRATAIVLLHRHLGEVVRPQLAASSAEAQAWVQACLADAAPYAAAARAFMALHKASPVRATEVAALAQRYVASTQGVA